MREGEVPEEHRDGRMFLYWKKRGAYELETLPPLSALGAERYSWATPLDAVQDLSGKVSGWGEV